MTKDDTINLERNLERMSDYKLKIVETYKPYIKRHSFPQVRCGFWLLAWANGCMFNCQYCWLKAYHPWPWNEIHIAEKPALTKVLERFSAKTPGSHLLNAGELCDSFVAPSYIPFMAETLRLGNEEYGRGHRLLLLTKSADPQVLLENDLQDVIVYSASINTESVAARFERGAPRGAERILAARDVKRAGYETRIRLDPIIVGTMIVSRCAVERFPRGKMEIIPRGIKSLSNLVEEICTVIEPDLLTLGSLRATPRSWRALPESIKDKLREKTPWGHGYPLDVRLGIYSSLIHVAGSHGVLAALCKEPREVWNELRLKGKCNCMA